MLWGDVMSRMIPVAAFLALLLGASPTLASPEAPLIAFSSKAELETYIAHSRPQEPPACPPDWPECAQDGWDEVVVTGSRITAPSITNNQEAGVDEGDIVKMRGDTLVILRRGRLFTVDTAGGGLRPVDSANAYSPDLRAVDADDDWYDEMLVAEDWVVVVGYSYGRGGTEINRFRLDRRGRIRFVDTHHLSSNDYYSSRNYASRLIGEQLVLYSPIEVENADTLLEEGPWLTRWRTGTRGERRRLIQPGSIYRSPPMADGDQSAEVLHAIVRCDLTRPRLTCAATAILGDWSRTFYVAPDATYVWLSGSHRGRPDALSRSLLYRVPLDGSAPRVARVFGAPTDQFSFAEDQPNELMRVLVRSQGDGDAMWRPEFSDGSVALLTLPLSRFGDGTAEPEPGDYRMLGSLPDNARRLVNRFTREHVLYSISARAWGIDDDDGQTLLDVVSLQGGPSLRMLLPGAVERIELVGNDALVVSRGSDDITFRTINLAADPRHSFSNGPHLTHAYRMENANGAETRSHAFFYQPEAGSPDGERGVMGLPVIRSFDKDSELFDEAADLAFLHRRGDQVVPIGELLSTPEGQADDGCQVSCVDWYGDARPIFVRNRIFALLGYELVEGVVTDGRIVERQRVSFAPAVREPRTPD